GAPVAWRTGRAAGRRAGRSCGHPHALRRRVARAGPAARITQQAVRLHALVDAAHHRLDTVEHGVHASLPGFALGAGLGRRLHRTPAQLATRASLVSIVTT